MLPKPGSKEYEDLANFMQANLVSSTILTKLIELARQEFKEQGKDFDEEFEKWKKRRDYEI